MSSKRSKQSAGLLLFRRVAHGLEVFLVHPGGPYWQKKNEGSWTIPKGEFDGDEAPLDAARREFLEETGFASHAPFLDLGSIRQKSGKVVAAWAFAGDCDPAQLISNTCEIEWPPRSGQQLTIPEIDRGAWFTLTEATLYLRAEQHPHLARLEEHLRLGVASRG
ncbi:Predicted NTP pyrophosphohydrolase, NUDIX family [Bryocella elongata]|uniref:Predicted NTP pyrophosphohydrolase, NUDIX family n=1 Tax=Bryocella elongata TaxID=863522 RepID=A0A1H5XPA7_9BACT|nr:NUDIX domain-containing protein [Bryocella elongata]SEG13200.1 Predicted NTP pyrophosphohydrolase, NUDIX family [Bryocella elongata]